MLTLGVDPDLHNTAVAVLDGDRVAWVALVHVPTRLKGRDAVIATLDGFRDLMLPADDVTHVAVEGQQVYKGVKGFADPADLLNLALVSGGCAERLLNVYSNPQIAIPQPAEWKGQTPKKVHHKRICKALGMGYTEHNGKVIPAWCADTILGTPIPPSQASHALDACGLALWAQTTKYLGYAVSPLSLRPSR